MARACAVVLLLAVALASGTASAAPAAVEPAPDDRSGVQVLVVSDDVRLRRADGARARAAGRALPQNGGSGGGEIPLTGFPGETLAFQLVILAGPAAIETASAAVGELAREPAVSPASTGGAPAPRTLVFREQHVTVAARSRNDRRPEESLGWLPGARPPDDEMLGEIPDALVPIALDPRPVRPGPAVPAGQLGAFWVDVEIPEATPQGRFRAAGTVSGDAAATLAHFTIHLEVLAPPLPYRATSAFVFYEPERLARRLGGDGAVAERRLWQLLHAHHVDALAPLASGDDVRRLAAVYDGSLFSSDRSDPGDGAGAAYAGAGRGLAPGVVALGAYGILGAPTPDSLTRVDGMLAALPTRDAIADVFLYAIDEDCTSTRGADWRRALAARIGGGRHLGVGQTCADPPTTQEIDVALIPAAAYARAYPEAARAAGRRAWIYNGLLPRTGTLLLDADPRGLIANGWIAAAMGIERWFYWESTFWDDDNRGGRGPIDPFATAASFHNRDGDTALGDGLLLYPGRQQAPFAARSLGYEGVLPSLRLKLLRRGIEDAGIIALAARERPAETAAIIARALPAALDEADPDRRASWETAPLTFSAAREALRRLVTRADAISPATIAATFQDLAARRRRTIPVAPTPDRVATTRRRSATGAGIAAVVLAATVTALWVLRRRLARRRPG